MYKKSLIFICVCLISLNLFSFILDKNGQNIVIYGDTRSQYSVHYKIMTGILSVNPNIIFNTGDLVYNGNNDSDWAKFIKVIRRVPFETKYYPITGNHEKESPKYYQHFNTLPDRKKWYHVDTNYIRFICLNTNVRIDSKSEQYKWLVSILESNKKDFIIVLIHTPIVTTGYHKPNKSCFHLMPLFEKYKVGAVFAGHNHNYERCYKDKIFYITTGGGGAPLYKQIKSTSDAKYSQKFISDYHFCMLQSEKDTLRCFVIDINGKIIDKFQIPKSLSNRLMPGIWKK